MEHGKGMRGARRVCGRDGDVGGGWLKGCGRMDDMKDVWERCGDLGGKKAALAQPAWCFSGQRVYGRTLSKAAAATFYWRRATTRPGQNAKPDVDPSSTFASSLPLFSLENSLRLWPHFTNIHPRIWTCSNRRNGEHTPACLEEDFDRWRGFSCPGGRFRAEGLPLYLVPELSRPVCRAH